MENKKINNGKIYSLIKYEYLRWLINPRIAIFACMLIFIVNYMVDVMVNASNTMGEPLGVFELFIATANSEEMCIIMPAVFFILIGASSWKIKMACGTGCRIHSYYCDISWYYFTFSYGYVRKESILGK